MRETIERAKVELTRDEALAIAAGSDDDRRDEIVLEFARFEEGDAVRWFESTRHPHNRGEVVDGPRLLGFPEVIATDYAIGYEVEFPGAEGVGREVWPVQERDLRFYDEEEGDG